MFAIPVVRVKLFSIFDRHLPSLVDNVLSAFIRLRQCYMMLKQATYGGFTLIECLVVISIIAVLTTMAVPSLQRLKAHAQQLRVIYQLQAAVLMARHLSIIERSAIHVCPRPITLTKGTNDSPQCGRNYGSGVAIWIEEQGGWRLLRVRQWNSVTIKNRPGTRVVSASVVFKKQGLANRNITWSTCVGERNLSLVLNRVGRPEVRRNWGVC